MDASLRGKRQSIENCAPLRAGTRNEMEGWEGWCEMDILEGVCEVVYCHVVAAD